MKIFISGSRSIRILDDVVKQRLQSIIDKHFDIVIGDCYGADTVVQKFLYDQNYESVTVFASNGFVRNNIGNWTVRSIQASSLRGFDFYCQKDIKMAEEANYGFVIWDGKSRGSLENIKTMTSMNKTVLVYDNHKKNMTVVKNGEEVEKLCQM